MNRKFAGETWMVQGDGPVYVGSADRDTHYTKPSYGTYDENLYKTPYDRTENMVSNGIMTNAYTGETYETFIQAMPPPNTDRSIPTNLLQKTNPKLIALQGGIDPNRPLRSKKEVCQDMPRADGGPNVWGDQLYTGRRRQRQMESINADLWHNRGGVYASELGFTKEQPAGFVGKVNMNRFLPHMPPTQVLDLKDWKPPVADLNGVEAMNNDPTVMPQVFTRKDDLTECSRVSYADTANGVDAEQVVPVIIPKPTHRGHGAENPTGVAESETVGGHVLLDFVPRPTLKEQMEQEFTTTQGGDENAGGHVILDRTVKPTLREQMQEPFPVTAPEAEGTGDYIPFQGPLYPTRRQFYEDKEKVGMVDGTGHADNVGPGEITTNQFRGTMGTYYPVPSKVVEAAGDSQTRWVGYSDRDLQREFAPHTSQADFKQENGPSIVVPRWYPRVSASCRRPDDLDDEWRTVRPTYFGETA